MFDRLISSYHNSDPTIFQQDTQEIEAKQDMVKVKDMARGLDGVVQEEAMEAIITHSQTATETPAGTREHVQ